MNTYWVRPLGTSARQTDGSFPKWTMKPPLTLFQCGAHSVAGMMGRSPAFACLALIGALGLAAPAAPQELSAPCRLCEPGAAASNEKPAKPISLDVGTTLDFDRLILSGGGSGTAELGPDGSRIASGAVKEIGARAMVGEVVIRGEPGRQVRIDLPGDIELFGLSGGSLRVEAIRSNLPPLPRLDSNGQLVVRFGGIVRVSGNADGDFRGNARINVEYF